MSSCAYLDNLWVDLVNFWFIQLRQGDNTTQKGVSPQVVIAQKYV
jgi:hypothetical protein